METLGLLELNKFIEKKIGEININTFWIRAKINELNEAYNGHCYLNLVEMDESGKIVAQNRANIWAATYRMLKPYFKTETGLDLSNDLNILIKVNVKFHSIYGLSLNIYDIDPSYTVGEVERAKQKVIDQLISDGIYDLNKSIPIPQLPQRLAIISSKTAAGYQDFVDQLETNQFNFKFDYKLFNATVQGDGARQSIINALDLIYNDLDKYDIVVIMRGGGSKSDLICFDDYELCANIAQFPLPVFTGIGHERDESVADLVANTNAKTPTAIAELIINIIYTEYSELLDRETFLQQILKEAVGTQKNKLDMLTQKLKSTSNLHIQKHLYLINNKLDSLRSISKHKIRELINELDKKNSLLKSINPKEILKKGYSINMVNGKRISKMKEIPEGYNELTTHFIDGVIESRITKLVKNQTV